MNKNKKKIQTQIEEFRDTRDLDETDVKIIYAKLTQPTWTMKQIGVEVGVCTGTVFRRLHKQKVEETLEDLTEDVSYLLDKAKVRAAKRISKLVDSTNEKIALEATKAVLASELQPQDSMDQGLLPIRFVTVVNDMGVLESSTQTIDVEADPSIDT